MYDTAPHVAVSTGQDEESAVVLVARQVIVFKKTSGPLVCPVPNATTTTSCSSSIRHSATVPFQYYHGYRYAAFVVPCQKVVAVVVVVVVAPDSRWIFLGNIHTHHVRTSDWVLGIGYYKAVASFNVMHSHFFLTTAVMRLPVPCSTSSKTRALWLFLDRTIIIIIIVVLVSSSLVGC
jgi:hypothetical protein